MQFLMVIQTKADQERDRENQNGFKNKFLPETEKNNHYDAT